MTSGATVQHFRPTVGHLSRTGFLGHGGHLLVVRCRVERFLVPVVRRRRRLLALRGRIRLAGWTCPRNYQVSLSHAHRHRIHLTPPLLCLALGLGEGTKSKNFCQA